MRPTKPALNLKIFPEPVPCSRFFYRYRFLISVIPFLCVNLKIYVMETVLSEKESETPGSLSLPDLASLKNEAQVEKASAYILQENDRSSPENTLSGTEIKKLVLKKFPSLETIAHNTFLQYLSKAVKNERSHINCEGKRQGYYFLNQLLDTEPEMPEQVDIEPRKQKEPLLYPVLESWLIAKGYQAADISKLRKLGKWGNPDIAGIEVFDTFNHLSIELVTIEAKTSINGWEQYIFEAISHRRFSNRSYFAFAHPGELVEKIPEDLRYYSELFNVGILVLVLERAVYDSIHTGKRKKAIKSEEVEILEIFPAPYNYVQPKYQNRFLEALDINRVKLLFNWGSTSTR